MNSLLKKPSTWIPIALSFTVLAAFIVGIAMFGPPAREPDEGTGAHLFQIWLVIEVFMVAFFAVKWLPQKPMQALVVLSIQIVAVLVACAPIFFFKL